MPDNRVTLVVEGTERDRGDVRVDVFLSELTKLHQALSRIDESASHGQRSSHFVVVGLSHESPATVELESRVNKGRQDMREVVVRTLAQAMENVQRGNFHEDIDYGLLDDLKALAAPVGNQLRAVTIKINGGAFDLTQEFAKKIELHLSQQETCIGTVEGMLERINVHDDANIFTIYPDVGAKSIACYFPEELVETALSSAKRRVAVTGTLRYRKFAPYAYQVQATELRIYDREDSLPTFDDLRGIAPDATGDESASDFIARFRDGWV